MIELKPLRPNDVIPFFSWLNEEEVIKYSMSIFQRLSTREQIQQWFDQLLEEQHTYNVGIFLSDTQELVGYAGISGISAMNKSGEYFIFIGDKEQWRKGIGTLVTEQVVAYGFDQLQLNRIMLTVSQPNVGGVKAYEKAGFIREGVLKEACYREGAFHDKIVMAMLRSTYVEKRKG